MLVGGAHGGEGDDEGDGGGELPLLEDVFDPLAGVDADGGRLAGDPDRPLGLGPVGHAGTGAEQGVLELGVDRQPAAVADFLDPLDRGV